MCGPRFSGHSYGFRPDRNCEIAIRELLVYFNEGYEWIVDIDLEKFFDNVPRDKLMSLVHNIINDGDTESLIRKYLKAGVMTQGRYERSDKGTLQGGNLSPLLSNVMLNELDRELEKRELRFVRYADDCVIVVRSEASAKMEEPPAWGISGEIQEEAERPDKPKPKYGIQSKDTANKLGNPGVDKLFCAGLNENSNDRDRRTFANTAANNLETMESSVKAPMGIAEVGNRKRPGEADHIHGRPLPMGSEENMCGKSNLKGKAETGGISELSRLL